MRKLRALTAFALASAVTIAGFSSISAAPAQAEKIQINVWLSDYPIPGHLDARIKMADEFNQKHPEYQVNVKPYDYTKLPQDIAAAAKRGEHPTIANYYSNAIQIARDTADANGKPLFKSVEQAIGDRTEILGEPVNIDDLLPPLRGYYSDRGDLTSLPVTAMTSTMFANTSVLDAAGVTELPRTWQELEAACDRIAALPNGPEHCVSWPNHNWFFQQALTQQGAPLVNRANGRAHRASKVDLKSPEMMTYVQWWKRLNDKGHYLYTTNPDQTWDGMFEAFGSQQVAFTFSSSNTAGMHQQMGQQAGFAVEPGRLPYNGEVPPVGNLTTGDSLWLAGGLDKATEDGALAFMLYLNNPDNAVTWHKSNHYLPVTNTAVAKLEQDGWFEQNPADRIAVDQLKANDSSPAGLGPVVGDFHGIQHAATWAMHDVLTYDIDPRLRFLQADVEAQLQLSFYNVACTTTGPKHPNCYRIFPIG